MNATNDSTDYSILLVEDEPQTYELRNQLAQKEFPQSRILYKNSFEQTVDY